MVTLSPSIRALTCFVCDILTSSTLLPGLYYWQLLFWDTKSLKDIVVPLIDLAGLILYNNALLIGPQRKDALWINEDFGKQ